MFLTDYHVHSTHSDDAENTMLDMAKAAEKRGIKRLCFTDHADECCDPQFLSFPPNLFLPQTDMYGEYERVREELSGKIDLRFGCELAAINHDPETAKVFWEDERFDFIIGSVHNVRRRDDFYFMKYDSEEMCREITEVYLDEYLEITRLGCCDVLGHLGYPEKYMVRSGFKTSVLDYPEKLRAVLKSAIEKGIGIEVNTSGLRCSLGKTMPGGEVIKLYRELGGEIITTGSDSHREKDAGAGIAEATELLRECGFKYVTTFTKHEPEFTAI